MGKKRDSSKSWKPRVVLYCRVATDHDEGRSLEAQKERLRQYAERQGYAVVAEVSEIGGGLSLDRPGIRELSGLAYRHAMDEVLAVNIDRFGRNTGDVLRFEGKLRKQHVCLNTPLGNPLRDYRRILRAFMERKG